VEKDKDGYFAFSPDLKGCCTQGESYEREPLPKKTASLIKKETFNYRAKTLRR
jgi:hypothetical protein